jgi:hypothetical protein
MSTNRYETEWKKVATTGSGVRAESQLHLTSMQAYLEIAEFFTYAILSSTSLFIGVNVTVLRNL